MLKPLRWCAVLLLACASSAHAQWASSAAAFTTPPPAAPVLELSPAAPQAPIPDLVLGGVLGGAGGFFLGALAGAGLEMASGCEGEWCGFGGAVLGAIVGESLGVPLGVHAFNRERGRYAPSALASLGIAVSGLYLLAHVPESGEGYVWSIPLIQIASSIYVERTTARPPR